MNRKSRLQSGSSKLRDNRLASEVKADFSKMPTSRVSKYAGLPDKSVFGNSVLTLSRDLARKELQNRQTQAGYWAKGKEMPKKPWKERFAGLRKQVGEDTGKFLKFAGEATAFGSKVLSGEAMREATDDVVTMGMKPAEKKRFIKESHKEEEDDLDDDFDLQKLQKEMWGD